MSPQEVIDLTSDDDEPRLLAVSTLQGLVTKQHSNNAPFPLPRLDRAKEGPERDLRNDVTPSWPNNFFRLSTSAKSHEGEFAPICSSTNKFDHLHSLSMPPFIHKRPPVKTPWNFASESSQPKKFDSRESITRDSNYPASSMPNGRQAQPLRPSWTRPLLQINGSKGGTSDEDLATSARELSNGTVSGMPISTRPSLTCRGGNGSTPSASPFQMEGSHRLFHISSPRLSNNLSTHDPRPFEAPKARGPPYQTSRWLDGSTGSHEAQHISGSESDTDNAGRALRQSIKAVAVMVDESDQEERRVTETEEIQDAASAQLLESVSIDTSAVMKEKLNIKDAENGVQSLQQINGEVARGKLGLEDHETEDSKVLSDAPLAPDVGVLPQFAVPRIHLHSYLRGSGSVISDVGTSKTEKSHAKEPSALPLELKGLKAIFRKHEGDMWAGQEYLMRPWLLQAKLHTLRAPQPQMNEGLSDPFADIEGVTVSGPIKPYLRPAAQNRVQLQSTLENGACKTVGVFHCDVIDYESDSPTLPIYKSIIRLGPNILAKNDKTLKYLPYFPEEEGPKGQKEGLYEELQKRYIDRVSNLSEQRRCAEMAEFWREYLQYFLDEIGIGLPDIVYFLLLEKDPRWQPDIKLSSQSLAAWMTREQDCPRCKMQIETKALARKWSRLRKVLPVPNGRTLALAGLASHVFLEATKFSIWHVASTACSIEKLFRRLDIEEPRTRKESPHTLCLLCHLHDCPTHGAYLEHGLDSSSSSDDESETDGELGHNVRQRVVLAVAPKSSMRGSTEGVTKSKTNLSCKDFLGRYPDGNVKGLFITDKYESTTSGLDDAEMCSEKCYWNLEKRPDITVRDILSHPHHLTRFNSLPPAQIELYRLMLPAYLGSRRAPCVIAAMMPDACCIDIFLKMLHEVNTTIRLESESRNQPMPPTKRPHSFDYWQDDSHTHDHDKRVPFIPCSHPGACDKSSDCSCYHDRVSCEWICGCAKTCARRYQGCRCVAKGNKVCFQDPRCDCWLLNRECDPWLCGTCGVLEVLDPVNRYHDETQKDRCKNARLQCDVPKRTLKGQSEVQGWGLFAGEDIRKNDFIGEYKGEIVGSRESDRRGAVYHHRGLEYLFKLNKDQEIDSSRAGNKMRFINNSCRKDIINVYPQKMLCNGVQRIGLFAKRAIAAGEELFFNYGYPKLVTKNFWERGEGPGQARAAAGASTDDDEEDDEVGPRYRMEKPKALRGKPGVTTTTTKRRQKKGIGRRISSLKQMRKNGKFSKAVPSEDEDSYEQVRRTTPLFLAHTEIESGLHPSYEVVGDEVAQGAEVIRAPPSSARNGKRKRIDDDGDGEDVEWTTRPNEPDSGREKDGIIARSTSEGRVGELGYSFLQEPEIAESDEDEEYEAENGSEDGPSDDEVEEDEEDEEEEDEDENGVVGEQEPSESETSGGTGRQRRIFGGDTRFGGQSQKLGWITRKQNMERMKTSAEAVDSGRDASRRERGVRTAKGSYRGVGGRPRRRGR